jgi:translation elongation factor EF-Tu-like GTPase
MKTKLSFDQDEDDTFTEAVKNVVKDPTIDTSFLPDQRNIEIEEEKRELEKLNWLKEQEIIKAEELNIKYILFDYNFTMNNIREDSQMKQRSVKIKKDDKILNILESISNVIENPEEYLLAYKDFIIPNVSPYLKLEL